MKDDMIKDEFSKKTVAAIGGTIVVAAIGLTWIVQGNEFFLAKVFAPKMEQVRRETFEQSKAYNEGKAQELRRMQSEYIRAAPEQKAALASVIVHQFADTDETKMPTDVAEFLRQIRQMQNRTGR